MESYCDPTRLVTMVDGIIAGQYNLSTPIFELMCTSLMKEKFNNELENAKTNFERLSIVEKCFPLEDFLLMVPPLDTVLLKNERIMCLIQDKANKIYDRKNLKKVLKCFNLAIMFAPETFLSHIYMERATLLIALGEYESVLKDVDNILSENISEKQKLELLEWKKKVEVSIAPQKTVKDISERQSYYEKNISKVFGQKADDEILTMAECISVEWNEQKERYLVTKQDLEPGTTVIVESAYVRLVIDHITWQTTYCNTCLVMTMCPIPCKTCVFAIYCCEACRLKDWNENGHIYECPLLPYLNAIQISRNMHLALKTVCKAGPEKLLNLCEFEKSKSHRPESTTSNLNCPEELISTDIYSHIASFKCHIHERTLRFTVWLAISLSKLFLSKTTFFNNIEESQRSELERFVAVMLIQHVNGFHCNTVAMYAEVEIDNINHYYSQNFEEEDQYIASGIFPFINMMEHSCAPTIFRQTLRNGSLAIITNQKLKAGNEISFSYALNYKNNHIVERKSYLSKYYHFNCNCAACMEKWPMLEDIQQSVRFLCPICNSDNQRLSKNLPSLHESKKNFGKCVSCQSKVPLNFLRREAEKYKRIMTLAYHHLVNNEPLKAIPLFIDCIKYYQLKICQPSIQLANSQTRFADCFDFIVNKKENPKILTYEKSPQRRRRRRYCSII